MNTVSAFCEAQGCFHDAVIPLDGWPDDMAIPDMALKLRCSKCGSRKIKMMINVTELYARTPGTGFKRKEPRQPKPAGHPYRLRIETRKRK
jgi:hypothetical protein